MKLVRIDRLSKNPFVDQSKLGPLDYEVFSNPKTGDIVEIDVARNQVKRSVSDVRVCYVRDTAPVRLDVLAVYDYAGNKWIESKNLLKALGYDE